jgi:hypothetical protein
MARRSAEFAVRAQDEPPQGRDATAAISANATPYNAPVKAMSN